MIETSPFENVNLGQNPETVLEFSNEVLEVFPIPVLIEKEL
jgi:hypothetical protein